MPSLLQIYSNNLSNTLVTSSIEFLVKQLYILHRYTSVYSTQVNKGIFYTGTQGYIQHSIQKDIFYLRKQGHILHRYTRVYSTQVHKGIFYTGTQGYILHRYTRVYSTQYTRGYISTEKHKGLF